MTRNIVRAHPTSRKKRVQHIKYKFLLKTSNRCRKITFQLFTRKGLTVTEYEILFQRVYSLLIQEPPFKTPGVCIVCKYICIIIYKTTEKMPVETCKKESCYKEASWMECLSNIDKPCHRGLLWSKMWDLLVGYYFLVINCITLKVSGNDCWVMLNVFSTVNIVKDSTIVLNK